MNSGSLTQYWVQDIGEPHVTERKIRNFSRRVLGWHFGDGVAFSQNVLEGALELHRAALAQGLFETDAFPGIRGQIVVTIYRSQHYPNNIIL